MREKKKRAKMLFNLLCDITIIIIAVVIATVIVTLRCLPLFTNEIAAFLTIFFEIVVGLGVSLWVDDLVDPKIERLRRYIQYKERQ